LNMSITHCVFSCIRLYIIMFITVHYQRLSMCM